MSKEIKKYVPFIEVDGISICPVYGTNTGVCRLDYKKCASTTGRINWAKCSKALTLDEIIERGAKAIQKADGGDSSTYTYIVLARAFAEEFICKKN